MQNRTFALAYVVVLMLEMPCLGALQDIGAHAPSAREQLQHIHTPQSIDQKLARLTKDLELTREQQEKIRPLLVEHHDRIHALLDLKRRGDPLRPRDHRHSDNLSPPGSGFKEVI